ncbi:RNA 2',3'-cyclic phosphodiesterase [Singulisphaera rosea]
MLRDFVARPIPDDTKVRLVAVQPRDIPGMRRLGHEELHLTLHFLGELDRRSIESLQSALAAVEADVFAIDIRGVGTFPRDAEPQVMWAGVESCSELTSLHLSVGMALTKAIGFRPEGRPYRPHVTLARFNTPIPSGTLDRHIGTKQAFIGHQIY